MVTEQKTINSVALRYRLGTILLWLGVFIWAPFIFLRAIGEQPVFLFFLPFHLIGVIGGARLRSIARRELGLPASKQNRLHAVGHLLILLGILVWAPYLYLKLVLGQPVEVMNFLPFHLLGVLGGVLLHVISYVIERQQKAPR
jgi:hypothetical protein